MTHNKKINTSKNLNKWSKGHSCASNPRNNKHRKLALDKRSALIKLDNNCLTVAAVKSHVDDISSCEQSESREDDIVSEDYRSNRDCKTFASNFTTQTIPAFARFFEKYNNSSVRHNRMLSIHSVLQERMKGSNIPETSTTYLCGLMELMEGVEDEELLDASLKLLSMVIKKANPAVLQQGFGTYSKILFNNFCAHEKSKYILVNLFGCLSVLLRAQKLEIWSDASTKHMITKILDYTTSENPKIRHAAQYNIAAIMKGSSFMPHYSNDEEEIQYVAHPMSHFVGKFILKMLTSCVTMKNRKATLHILVFLKLAIASLPAETLMEICQVLLQIIHIGDTLDKKCAMEVILALFKGQVTSFNSDNLACLVRALTVSGDKTKGLILIPNINDSTMCGTWMSVVTHGIVSIVKLEQDLGFKILISCFEQLVYCWNSDHASIHDSVVENIDILMDECIFPLGDKMATREAEMLHILSTINKGLSLQCQHAWNHVFRSISSAVHTIGPHLPQAVSESVKKVSEFTCPEHTSYWKSVDSTIGKAIESIGVEAIMKILPIQITGNSTDEKNLWILPIIRKHVKNASLCFFKDYFSPLADKCQLIVQSLDNKKTVANSKASFKYKTAKLQIWGLFAPFAKHATDQEQVLADTQFCIKLKNLMTNCDDIRKEILLGLRNMIENCSLENPGRMAQYAKNYIPVLCNLFRTMPSALAEAKGEKGIDNSHRLVAFETIKLYFKITPEQIIEQLFSQEIQMLNEENNSFTRKSLILLLREFVPYITAENLQKTYEIIGKYLNKKSVKGKKVDSEMQKSAYRVVEKIWRTKNEPCSDFIKNNLWEIFDMLKMTSRRNVLSTRLNIMLLMLENLPTTLKRVKIMELLRYFIDTGVQCCTKQTCKRPRTAAYRLLFAVGTAMQKLLKLSTKDMVKEFLRLLPSMPEESVVSAKIDVVIVMLLRYKDVVDDSVIDGVMKEILDHLVKNSAVITGSCLSFLSEIYRFWPVVVMSDFVDVTVIQISNMNRHCREVKHRMAVRKVLCRLLRKFGSDRIKTAIPDDNIVMKKVLKNLITLEAQKTKEKTKGFKDDENDHEDVMPASGLAEILEELEIDDEDEGKTKMPRKILKNKLYIKEGDENEVTNLLDPSSLFTKARKVRFATSEPQSPKKSIENSFKIDAKTGKFVIEEEDNAAKEKKGERDFFMNMVAEDALMERAKRTIDSEESEDEVDTTPRKKQKTIAKLKKCVKTIGAQFKAKKAGGDVQQKAGVLPYAYVKLDRKILNRRFQSRSSGQFTGVVKKGIRQAPRQMST